MVLQQQFQQRNREGVQEIEKKHINTITASCEATITGHAIHELAESLLPRDAPIYHLNTEQLKQQESAAACLQCAGFLRNSQILGPFIFLLNPEM